MARYRWVVLSVGTLAAAGYAAVPLGLAAIAPELADHYGLSVQQIGVLFGVTGVGQAVLLIPWGVAADRRGERVVISVGLALTAAALLAATQARSFSTLIAILTLVAGFGASAAAGSGRAVMQWFARRQRGLALGIRQTAIPLGGAASALALPPLTAAGGVDAAYVALAGVCGVSALLSVALLREGPASPDETEVGGRPLRDRRLWVLCLGSVLVLVAQIAIMNFVVLFLHDARGVSTSRAAAVLAGIQIVAAGLRIGGGKWTDRDGRRVPLFRRLAVALALAMATAAALVGASLWLLIPVLLVAGALGMSWNGLSFTAAAEIAGRARAGAAVGFQQTALAVGTTITPILFGLVAASSWRLAFALSAICPLAGSAVLRPFRDL